jgi:hypothetical protein
MKLPILFILANFSPLLLMGCSSGGTPSSDGQSKVIESTPQEVTCPANLIEVEGLCQCPTNLVLRNEYCIDSSFSVLKGAEFLEPGFPINITLYGGAYSYPVYIKAGNIDQDDELELLYMHGFSPEIFAVNSDGSILEGWPTYATTGFHGKLLMAQLDSDPELEVFSGHRGTAYIDEKCEMNAFDYDGSLLPGWPVECGSSITLPPLAIDLNRDGIDEIIYKDGTNSLNYVDSVGLVTPISVGNMPRGHVGWCGMSAGDIDGDMLDELILISCDFNDYSGLANSNVLRGQRNIVVLGENLSPLAGFLPIQFKGTYNNNPIIVDVDGDGKNEIIIASGKGLSTNTSTVEIFGHNGELQKSLSYTAGSEYTGPLSLAVADLDGNGNPEILMSLKGEIHAVNYETGVNIEGYPVKGGYYFAVGDIDGGLDNEVVTFLEDPLGDIYDNRNLMAVYRDDGTLVDVDVVIDYSGRYAGEIMPTIVDFDLDGRNEIVVAGNYWEGEFETVPQLWVFDLGGENHKQVEWGQMFGDERNSGKAKR